MDKNNLIKFVQNVLPMTAEKAAQLMARYHEKYISRNEFLLKAGSVCNESIFVESGVIRAYTYDFEGNEVTTGLYTKYMYAGDMFSFFKRTPTKEYIQALTDCEAWYITFEDMQMTFNESPEYREFGRRNIMNNYGILKQRTLSSLQETAEQRYASLVSGSPEILQNVPLKYIASYLGITDSSLSRIRKQFIKSSGRK
jgi:CRP-like cAMP-binding protein